MDNKFGCVKTNVNLWNPTKHIEKEENVSSVVFDSSTHSPIRWVGVCFLPRVLLRNFTRKIVYVMHTDRKSQWLKYMCNASILTVIQLKLHVSMVRVSLFLSLARSLNRCTNVNIVIRCTCQNITAAHTSRNSIHLDNRFLLIVAQICRHPLSVSHTCFYFIRYFAAIFALFCVLNISSGVATISLHIHRCYKFKWDEKKNDIDIYLRAHINTERERERGRRRDSVKWFVTCETKCRF